MLRMRTTIHHVMSTYTNWSEGAEHLEWDCDQHPDIHPMAYLRDVRGISPYELVRGEIKCPSDVEITISLDRDYTDEVEIIVRKGS